MALNQIQEGIDIRGFERVQADPIVHRALDPDYPALPADLDRNVQRGMLRTGRRGGFVPWEHLLLYGRLPMARTDLVLRNR